MTVTTLPGVAQTALACRVIPCLDVADGEVVKGVRFEDLEGFGSPAAAALRYCADGAAGADELVFLDIAASHERRGPAPRGGPSPRDPVLAAERQRLQGVRPAPSAVPAAFDDLGDGATADDFS